MSKRENGRKNRACEEGAEAFVFDLDGVLTDTAEAHADAWKQMFDEYLAGLEKRRGEAFGRFDREQDYLEYVDGKPRYDGVRSFLESLGIELETGSPEDPPDRETVCGLGNRKNELYQEFIERGGVTVYPEVPEVVRRLKSRGIKVAVVSSSKNCKRVLEAAGIGDLFEVRVDGKVSEGLGLEGKPAPDIFLKAAEELGVPPDRAVVVEDAISGVRAGRRGKFGCVVGMDRGGSGRSLEEHGADLVVSDLTELEGMAAPKRRTTTELDSALQRLREILDRLGDGKPALFLDYDGTLTPIVERPEDAMLSSEMRRTIGKMARRCVVAVVSGRGLEDVRERVGLEALYYAGSHGFEIEGPGQQRVRNEKGADALPALDEAEVGLRERLAGIDGAQVERKKFSIAVHYRRVAEGQADAVGKAVDEELQRHSGLRKGQGKKVYELQPDVDWDKGRAVRWLMERLGVQGEAVKPIYIGDDVTDEDAFRALQTSGTGIVVHGGEKRQTYATFGLADPGEVRVFLQKLAAAIDGGD